MAQNDQASQIKTKLKSVYDALQSHDYNMAVRACDRKDLAQNPLAKVRERCSNTCGIVSFMDKYTL